MVRKGVTKEQVVNTVTLLKSQGERLTADNIRAKLGTGSKSTIVEILRNIRREHPELFDKVSVPMSSEIFEKFQDTFSLWITVEAEKQNSDYILVLEAENEKLKEENMNYQTMCLRMEGELKGYASQHTELIARIENQGREHTETIEKMKRDQAESKEKTSNVIREMLENQNNMQKELSDTKKELHDVKYDAKQQKKLEKINKPLLTEA